MDTLRATSVPLLDASELQTPGSSVTTGLTSFAVKDRLKEIQQNGQDISAKTNEILRIMGGIDHVLEMCLSQTGFLDDYQLMHINDVLESMKIEDDVSVGHSLTVSKPDSFPPLSRLGCFTLDFLRFDHL